MSETLSEFAKRMEDKESWLASLLEKEPDGSCEATGLYATAALVRGALNALEVPETAQSASRTRGLQLLEERWAERHQQEQLPRPWLGRLGSWLQVAFNLIKRR
jgi:hypothetical protein